MKRTLSLLALLGSLSAAQADIIQFNLSPGGLSPTNEVPAVTNSSGSGDKISSGISFDTASAILSFNIGYGSDQGFSDLTGPATYANIQSPASFNENAGEQFNITPFLTPASDPAKGGTIIGSVGMNAEQSSNLLAGLDYVNIHTDANPDGELRGQLIPVTSNGGNTPPILTCPGDATLECTGKPINLTAHVSDAQGEALKVIWCVNGTRVQTNNVSAKCSAKGTDVVLPACLKLGTNLVSIKVCDTSSNTVSCSSTIILQDTTPPTITGCWVTPKCIWPPNHKLIPVEIKVCAVDSCKSAAWKIISVTSNEPIGSGCDDKDKDKDNGKDKNKEKGNDKGTGKGGNNGKNGQEDGKSQSNSNGHTAPDWVITSDHCVQLRAERSGKGSGRVYTITVQATDCSGNISAPKILTVTVPHSQNKK
ncbi:MAG: domain containing protein [Pedosphaera sp.]|nr:domain containing protein [Pedosphaera sp.]